MSKARERYYDYQRLCPNSGFIYAEEITNYVSELEQQNKELRDILFELYSYDFKNLDWNEAANIKSLIESALNK